MQKNLAAVGGSYRRVDWGVKKTEGEKREEKGVFERLNGKNQDFELCAFI